jgi:hypothetical protein
MIFKGGVGLLKGQWQPERTILAHDVKVFVLVFRDVMERLIPRP